MTEAVILAAGYSSRAGVFKMALDFGGKTMLQRNIEAMYDLCSHLYVVGGHQVEEVNTLVRDYEKVSVVYNKDYPEGMFSSVKTGVARIESPRFFITPGDYPLLTSSICESLLQAEGQVVIPTFQGRKGHPILLQHELKDSLLKEPITSNLKRFIQRQAITLVSIEDRAILIDVDTMEDYTKAKNLIDPEERV